MGNVLSKDAYIEKLESELLQLRHEKNAEVTRLMRTIDRMKVEGEVREKLLMKRTVDSDMIATQLKKEMAHIHAVLQDVLHSVYTDDKSMNFTCKKSAVLEYIPSNVIDSTGGIHHSDVVLSTSGHSISMHGRRRSKSRRIRNEVRGA